jgi:hypothetical protein
MGVLRDLVIAETDAEAKTLWRGSGCFCGREWLEPFGLSKGMEDPKTGEASDLWDNSLALVGSVDTLTQQLERLVKRLPIRWIFAWIYNGLMPYDRVMKTLELFWTEVLPRAVDAG